MTIYRWIIGVLSGLLASGFVFSLLAYMVGGDERWGELSSRLRHYTYLILLFWFNTEVWGRVVYTIVTW